jgi:uncharacterized protein YbjT (DUF2867 family)
MQVRRAEPAVGTLVIGATGNVGRELAAMLRRDGVQVRTMSRRPDPQADPDVDSVEADLLDPPSLRRALDGIRLVFIAAPIPVLAVGTRNLCHAAVEVGVDRIVLLSSSIVELHHDDIYSHAHRNAEAALRDCGISATILKPGTFSSNTLAWVGSIASGSPLTTIADERPVAPVDPRDIAAVAATALRSDAHAGRAISLAGPTLISPPQQVTTLSGLLKLPLRYEPTDRATAIAQLTGDHGRRDAVKLVDALRHPDRPWATPSNAIETITGRPATPFDAWARRNLKRFAPTKEAA